MRELEMLRAEIVACRRCPRLVRWREAVARTKVRRFREWDYWGKPVPGFGDPTARLLIVGLAPAAHGGNRTGRMFTGDRSGDWLYGALHRFGFASQAFSESRSDSMKLKDCYITATCRCAPPQNKLLSSEILNCREYLHRELRLLKNLKVVLALGKVGFDTAIRSFRELGWTSLNLTPAFTHGAEARLNERVMLVASFHPSQQNTFTGKLTKTMFHSVFRRAKKLLEKQ